MFTRDASIVAAERQRRAERESRPRMYHVTLQCAWCKQTIGMTPEASSKQGNVSHGICPTCAAKQYEIIDQMKQQ